MIGKINWNPGKKELRIFSLIIIGGCLVVSVLMLIRQKMVWAEGIAAGGVIVAVLSVLSAFIGKIFYRIWMGVGFVIGGIVSRIVLVIIFFLVLSPIALIFKIMGRDELKRKKPDNLSYWNTLPESDLESYRHIF